MTPKNKLLIATRKSPLALWQAQFVQKELKHHHPHLSFQIVEQSTEGDTIFDKPLAEVGGKDLFVKDIQKTLLAKNADIAVHSIKDMSVHPTPGLSIAAYCKREDARDVFISKKYNSLAELPEHAILGTASPRRQSQALALHASIRIKPIRGNVGTRLKKLDGGDYDAIILAAAGIKRLGLERSVRDYFDPQLFVPAIGQGAIAVECRSDDTKTLNLLQCLDHHSSRQCVIAERAVNRRLNGDCFTPLGAHAVIVSHEIHLSGMVGSLDGTTIIRSEVKGPIDEAESIGLALGEDLLKKGADKLVTFF